MNNIGFGEIMVLFILGLIVFGPTKLPEIARNLGKALNAFRTETQKAARTLRDAVEEPPKSHAPAGVYDRPDEQAPQVPQVAGTSPLPPVNAGDLEVHLSNGAEPDAIVEPTARDLEDT